MGTLAASETLATLGTPTFITSPTNPAVNVGHYTITVSGLSNANYDISYDNTGTLDITARPITVTADAKSKVYGQADPSLTYQVTTGTLVVGDSFSGALSRVAGENPGIYALQQGALALSTNYILTYVGANLTINKADTTTTLSSSVNPSLLNQSVTFTATVAVVAPGAGTRTGTVTFKDGSTIISTGPVNASGIATFTTSALAVGAHPITAVYGGDANFNGSTSSSLSQQVSYASTGSACYGEYGHTILQPVNGDGSSVFKQKSTVPAKFRVCDANGVSVGTPGVVRSFILVVSGAGTINEVDEAVTSTTPDTTFRWDPTAQQWIFNMDTKNLSANMTYVYRITLNDNSTIDFRFGLK